MCYCRLTGLNFRLTAHNRTQSNGPKGFASRTSRLQPCHQHTTKRADTILLIDHNKMVDYTGKKVAELKELLKERGLSVSGTKAELVTRLEEADSSVPEEKTETAAADTIAESEADAGDKADTEVDATEEKKDAVSENKEEAGEKSSEVLEDKVETEVVVEEDDGQKKEEVIAELEKRIKRNERFGANEDQVTELKTQIERIKKFGLEKRQADNVLGAKVLGNKVGKKRRESKSEVKKPLIDEATLKRRQERFGLA